MNILIICAISSVYRGNFIPSIIYLKNKLEIEESQVYFAFPYEAKKREWMKDFDENECCFYQNRQIKAVRRFIKEKSIEVIYSHFSPQIEIKLMITNRNILFVRHIHTDMNEKRNIKDLIKRIIYPSQMVSFYVSEKLKSQEKINPLSSYYLPNALVRDRFNLDDYEINRKKIREKFSVPIDGKLILMFGWHQYIKGVDIAVKAFEKAFMNDKSLYLMIVCGENANKDSVRNIAIHNECKKHIICAEPYELVHDYYFASDVFLSASRSEGFSYSIMEAIYLSKPVITSRLDAVEWCKKYNYVLFFESENIDMLADTLLNALEFDYDKEKFQENSVNICNDYAIDKWARFIIDKMTLSYNKMLKK